MAGNRNATPAQPTVGAGSTRSESRGGLFSGNIDPNINANAAQQVAIDTAEAEAAARAAEAAATSSAMSAATATREAGRATMEADRAAESAAEAARDAMLAEDWVEGPSHGGYTYTRAVRDDMGNLLGTWTGQTTPGTVEEYLAADVMTRGNFIIDRETITIAATDDPTDTNNSQYWVTQAANGAFEAAEAEVELLDAIARAANINIDVTLLEAIVAYGRFLDIGEPLLTTEERGVLDTANILPLSATISNAQFENAGEFPVAGVIYSARAYSNLAQREANRAESEADSASTSANNAATSAASAATEAAQAAASVAAAQAAVSAAQAAETAAEEARQEARAAAGLDTMGQPTNSPAADSAAGYRNQANAAATRAETAENNAQAQVAVAADWAEGTDTEVQVLGGTHSSEGWATVANYWAGFGVTVDTNTGAITVNDGPLDQEVAGAHSSAYWAEQARMHAAAVAHDEITVETGSTTQSDVRTLEFNENYFTQDDMTMHQAVINLSSENVFMRWNADFSYINGSSFVTFGGNLYKNIGPNGGQVTPGTDDTVWQLIDLTNADLSMIEREIMELQTSLGNPMQTASATGSAYQRILQLVADLATANRAIGDNTNSIGTNTTNIATNTRNIATNTMNIATNTGNISTLQTDVTTNTDNITNLSANQITILSDIEDLQMEIVDIPTSGDTTVNHGALARVIGNNFNELYWRFGATVSGVRFSDFVGTNNSPRDNLTGYVRLSQTGGGSGGTTVHYQTANGVTTDLTEVEYDLSNASRGPQILLTGQPSTGSATIDTIQLMEPFTDTIPDGVDRLDAVRIGDTIFRVGTSVTPPAQHPTLTLRPSPAAIDLYQDPAMVTITVTGTIGNGGTILASRNIEQDVTVSGVTVDANSIMRTSETTFTFTVTINTQTEPAANHPFTVAIAGVREGDGGSFDIPAVRSQFSTRDARMMPTATLMPNRFNAAIPKAMILADDMPAVQLAFGGSVAAGTAYDLASFTRGGGMAENFMNQMGSYELVADDIPDPSGSDITIPFTFNFNSPAANMQTTPTLTASVTTSVYTPWGLQRGRTAPDAMGNLQLIGDPVWSTDVISSGAAAVTINKMANENVFLLSTRPVTEVNINMSQNPNGVTSRGDIPPINNIQFVAYQLFNDDSRPAGMVSVVPTQVTGG